MSFFGKLSVEESLNQLNEILDYDENPYKNLTVYEAGVKILKSEVFKTTNGYEIFIEVPGLVKEDIDIKFKDSTMTVTANKEEADEDEDVQLISSDFIYGNLTKSFYFGVDDIDVDNISASLDHGILCIVLPLQTKPKDANVRIEID